MKPRGEAVVNTDIPHIPFHINMFGTLGCFCSGALQHDVTVPLSRIQIGGFCIHWTHLSVKLKLRCDMWEKVKLWIHPLRMMPSHLMRKKRPPCPKYPLVPIYTAQRLLITGQHKEKANNKCVSTGPGHHKLLKGFGRECRTFHDTSSCKWLVDGSRKCHDFSALQGSVATWTRALWPWVRRQRKASVPQGQRQLLSTALCSAVYSQWHVNIEMPY